jgi:hypothetical protein
LDISRVVVPWAQLFVFLACAVWAGKLEARVANLEDMVGEIREDVRGLARRP